MQRMADALQRENEVYRKAAQYWENVTAEDRAQLWAACEEQMRLGDEIKAMLLANPTWVEVTCQWYDEVIRKVDESNNRLIPILGKEDNQKSRRYFPLLLDSFPSTDHVGAWAEFLMEHPGSVPNLRLLCVRFGRIEQ